MSYGAHAKRVPAKGGGPTLGDVDIYKVGLIGKTERGFKGLVQDGIYGYGDYAIKCGEYGEGIYNTPYIAKSFYEELESSNPVEMKVLSFVADDAANAVGVLNDIASSPVKVWDVKAAKKGILDMSVFGNKIAVEVVILTDITMALMEDIEAGATSLKLSGVHNLEEGAFLKLTEGATSEYVEILTIDAETKTITVDATTGAFGAASSTVARVDIEFMIAVKTIKGDFEKVETFKAPLIYSMNKGITGLVNDPLSGSNYVYLEMNVSSTSIDAEKVPGVISSWQALAGGSDGIVPTDNDYKEILNNYFIDADISILLAPESSSITHNQNMMSWASADYKCMYYAQAPNKAGEESLKVFGDSMRQNVAFAMLPSDKWIETTDPLTKSNKEIPKVGIDAAFWFNVYSQFGEAKVAAGNKPSMVLKTKGRLIDDNGLVHNDLAGKGGRLIRDYGINISKFTLGKGITNNSARTFSLDKGYTFQNQIMAWLLYRKSILTYLTSIEQDKAGKIAQKLHYTAVYKYMKRKYDSGQLYTGGLFQEVCLIVNDFSNNTLADIANGKEQTFLQFIAPPPIEEPILSLASAAVTTMK